MLPETLTNYEMELMATLLLFVSFVYLRFLITQTLERSRPEKLFSENVPKTDLCHYYI